MARSASSQTRSERRAWYAALATALVLSLLPTRWLVGWTSDVAQLVNVPIVALKHPFSLARAWLRPMPDPREAEPEKIQALESDLDAARTLYKRMEIENELLKERIALLEGAKLALLDGARAMSSSADRARTMYATVVGATPASSRSPSSLTLNVGSWHGITPGMVATWNGDVLVGRVADTVERFTSLVIPANGLNGFEVRFFPPDRDIPAADAPVGLLKATKEGIWTTDLRQASSPAGDIAEGWIARIADERWPQPSRGLRVGVVERVGPRDDAPLLKRVTVRPLVDALRVPHVVLIDESVAIPAESAQPAKGSAR